MHHHTHDRAGCCHAHTGAPFDPSALVSARGLKLDLDGRPVLMEIDIDVHPREILTLIGPNGSGKTTLIRVLLGLAKPDRGEVHRAAGLRIGYVPQRFDLDRAIPMTVERFLALGTASGGNGSVTAVLEEVGAARLAKRQLGELSGGELQRVVLARALLRDPGLLVLDEPVRGVDYVGEAELYRLIGRLRDKRDLGVLLVSTICIW
jgi:ABC-type Mn/Zn transport systems, ATPase component